MEPNDLFCSDKKECSRDCPESLPEYTNLYNNIPHHNNIIRHLVISGGGTL